MADCFDLGKQLEDLRQQKALNEELSRRLAGQVEQLKPTAPGQKRQLRRLKLVDGDYLEVDPQRFWHQVEADAIEYGERAIGQHMSNSVEGAATAPSRSLLNIPFHKVEPTEENVKLLIDVLGLRLDKSTKGIQLNRPFTEGAANAQFIAMAKAYNADPTELAHAMKSGLRGIDKLPVNSYIVKRVRDDAVQLYADSLEELADLVDLGAVTQSVKTQIGNIAQWAHYWNQFDRQVSRSIAQALKARQHNWAGDFQMLFNKPIELFTYDDIAGNTLKQQILEHISAKDPLKLKELATAARLGALDKKDMVKGPLMTQAEMLNFYRQDNMYSSPATWLERNVIGGVTVAGVEGFKDIVEGGLRKGVKETLEASGHAWRSVQQGQATAWRNAWNSFAYGKTTYNVKNFEEIAPEMLVSARTKLAADLNASWDSMTDLGYHLKHPVIGTAVSSINLLSTAFRYFLLDPIVEKSFSKFGVENVSAGTAPSFRLMGAGDEWLRKTAFDWKVSHEAYLRASDEAKAMLKEGKTVPDGWVGARAEEMAQKAVFSGLLTDDDLAQIRLREIPGVPAGDFDNDALRLKMFNDMNGVPNKADALGAIGIERGDGITFSQDLNDVVTSTVQGFRRNPFGAYLIPAWRATANGAKWVLNHDLAVNLVRQLALEGQNAIGGAGAVLKGKQWADGALDPEVLAKYRATAITSVALAGLSWGAWETGFLSDGGPPEADKVARENWLRRNKPYSFSLGAMAARGTLMKVSGKSIDLFDLLALQTDVMAAWQRGTIEGPELGELLKGFAMAYGRVIESRNSLKSVMALLNLLTAAKNGREVDVWGEVAKLSTGTLPLSGLFTGAHRAFEEPGARPVKFRAMTPAEYQALGKDPNWEFVQHVLSRVFKSYPGLTEMFPPHVVDTDWIGSKVQRVLGLPYDQTMPFMPVVLPDKPLYRAMERYGMLGMPRPDGVVGVDRVLGVTSKTNMTWEQEKTYRKAMYSLKGQLPAESILGSKAVIDVGTAVFRIDDYVQGRNLEQALTKLLVDDPEYRYLMESAPDSPSLVKRPNQSLGARTGSENDPRGIGEVAVQLKNYYDKLALNEMFRKHPEFVEMMRANVAARNEKVLEALQGSPIGVGRL